jgi:hypothetical protein
MTKKLLALLLLAGGCAFAVDFNIGIRIGPPPAPRVVRTHVVSPGPGYVWIDGYWYPNGSRYAWHNGYWTRPPYEGALWIGPRHDGQQYFEGHWEGGGRQPVGHDHRWDRDRNRDYDRH